MSKSVDSYRNAVAGIPCMVCADPNVQIHHCKGGSMRDIGVFKGMGQKTGEENIIPLCLDHHTGAHGIHTVGVITWEAEYGRQVDMLIAVSVRLEAAPRRAVSKKREPTISRLSKILPRRRPC